ncbi:retropepsin family aspartate protease, DUF4124-containing [Geotalea daltonii FRC-32]|uniref:Retropepsin family aspartate protease, DUF4124-containing n=1 Tax=Geotalea daltonii (strain DSM 22248 / JCM 15807 / FRC-32) TaxID=316067 RepID=B9M9M6_GEODF|nr:retropepsin-like aspartic protease [Geotalea daltonii]ACM20598.1 retropepsin family aspartate protease, DUF4124-containing [Geotalea daltonii FRC-32]
MFRIIYKLLVKMMCFAIFTTLVMPATGQCEFYQYEDENGAVNFTDDPGKIPKKLKKKHKVRSDDDDNPQNSVMRVRILRNRVLLPVTLSYRGNEVKANLVLDTGAEVSTISSSLAARLRIRPEDADLAYAQGIGSGIQVTGRVSLDYMLVGPNRKYDMDVIVVESGGYDGLLGMNFLRELRYHVDFNTSTIKWGD